MPEKEKNPIWAAVEKPNYHWSRFTWRIDLAAIPFFAVTGNAVGAALAGVAYWWDRRSIINYQKEHNIPPAEKATGLFGPLHNLLDPSKGRGSQRLAYA